MRKAARAFSKDLEKQNVYKMNPGSLRTKISSNSGSELAFGILRNHCTFLVLSLSSIKMEKYCDQGLSWRLNKFIYIHKVFNEYTAISLLLKPKVDTTLNSSVLLSKVSTGLAFLRGRLPFPPVCCWLSESVLRPLAGARSTALRGTEPRGRGPRACTRRN